MELEIRYEPLHEDYVKFIEHPARYKAIFAEFRSGKTTLAGLMTLKAAWDYPGLHVVVVRNYRADLYDSTIPQFRNLYDWEAYGGEFVYTHRVLKLQNGSIIAFRALDRPADVKKLKNIEIGWFWVDQAEEVDESIWQMLEGRLSQKGMPNAGIATGNPEGKNWVYYKFFANPLNVRKGVFKGVEREYGLYTGQSEDYLGLWPAPFLNEPNLPPGYYDRLIASNPKPWVDKYVFGKWSGYEGLVYSAFRQDNIVEEGDYFDPPEHWALIEAMDYGMANPTVWLWLWHDPETDIIWVTDEYYVAGETPGYHAPNVLALRSKLARQPMATVGCPRVFQRERDGATPADEYSQRYGIHIQPMHASLEARWARVAARFEQKKLMVFRRCTNLIRELESLRWDNMKTASNHAVEALERGVMKIEQSKAALVTVI